MEECLWYRRCQEKNSVALKSFTLRDTGYSYAFVRVLLVDPKVGSCHISIRPKKELANCLMDNLDDPISCKVVNLRSLKSPYKIQ